jgi:predicted nuclease of predicted toxin-antitoxin system
MRIKLDENLPIEIVAELVAVGHDVEHVYDERLSGRPDPDIWRAAQDESRLLITQDIRFGDAAMFSPGEHAGFVLVRLKRPGRQALIQKIVAVFTTEAVGTWSGAFVVLSDSKLRVRRRM